MLKYLARGIRWVRLAGDLVQHSDVDLYRRRFAETCRLVVAVARHRNRFICVMAHRPYDAA